MQQNSPEQNYHQEDEIDLKELFGILWAKKTFIISITTAITLIAGIYAFNKTPIYKATALVEIGSYKFHNTVFINNNNNNNNNKILIDSSADLSKKLNLLFPKTVTSKPKKLNSFLEIKSTSISVDLAKEKVKKTTDYLIALHDKHLNKTKVELESIKGNLVYNYKNSQVIGSIKGSTIQPKINLIITVGFIAGFILSIFLVFIMNAFRKEDDKTIA